MITSQLDMKKAVFGQVSSKISACRRSAQKWCQDCWMMVGRNVACWCVRTSLNPFKMNQTCFVNSSLVTRHGFSVSIGNHTFEQSVKVIDVAEESKTKWKVNIILIFCFDVGASFTASSCYWVSLSISKSTRRSLGLCFVWCARKDERYGGSISGFFTTTLHLLTTSWV